MKLIIDIDKEWYSNIIASKDYIDEDSEAYLILNGKPYEEIPHEKWEYLKEHITELRDANGYATQYGTCQFILNLMRTIEKEGERDETL